MRIVEARFHFFPSDPEPVVVGRIVWLNDDGQGRPSIHPTFASPGRRPVQIVSELKTLVESVGPDAFHGLLLLRTPSWSFKDVSDGDEKTSLVQTVKRVSQASTAPGPTVVVR